MNRRDVLALMLGASVVAATGCDPDESVVVAGANTAGNLALSTWFALDAPDDAVVRALDEIVGYVSAATVDLGTGEPFVDAVMPQIQKAISGNDKLTPAQRNLVNTGSVVILNGLDAYIATNERVRGNVALTARVVASFVSGCRSAIGVVRPAQSARLARAHALITR